MLALTAVGRVGQASMMDCNRGSVWLSFALCAAPRAALLCGLAVCSGFSYSGIGLRIRGLGVRVLPGVFSQPVASSRSASLSIAISKGLYPLVDLSLLTFLSFWLAVCCTESRTARCACAVLAAIQFHIPSKTEIDYSFLSQLPTPQAMDLGRTASVCPSRGLQVPTSTLRTMDLL